MEGWKDFILLENPKYFDFGNGLWKGKKPPFIPVTVIRNTNFTDSGEIDYSNVAILDVETKQFQKRQLVEGDIIIERSGGGPKQPVGRVVYFSNSEGDFSFSNFTSRIRVIDNKFDSKYIFYHLMYFYSAGKTISLQAQTTGIRNLDFNKYKKTVRIPDIPLPEQRKIAYVLSTMQKAIEQQDKLIRTTTELKKALMQKLFTEGLHGKKQKETDFGFSPENWVVQPFENTGEVVYGIQAAVAKNLKPIGYKILTNKNITLDGKIDLEKLNYFELSTKRHFQTILQKGDLLFNWRSGSKEHVGKTAIFDLEADEYTHSSFILRIRVNQHHHNEFLYYYLNFLRETGYYQKVQTYSINAKFNKSAINAMPIALPEKEEQIEIANILVAIDYKLNNILEKKNVMQDLFKTMLHELMTGQQRVNEIDFEPACRKARNEKEELLMAAEPEIKYNE
jgi:type I restriction enzyme S subunit